MYSKKEKRSFKGKHLMRKERKERLGQDDRRKGGGKWGMVNDVKC